MPKIIKKRVAKKVTPKETEVKSVALQVLDSIRERKKQLVLILSAVGVIALLYVVFILYTSSSNREAYSLEKEAYNYYYGINLKGSMTAEERWNKALGLYKKSIEIKATPTALFYLGNCYYNLGDYSHAIKQYSTFIDRFRGEEEILPLVYQKLAAAYFKSNRSDKAIETLGILAQFKNGIFKDTALVLEARYYETSGESKKAMKKYKELVNEFPASPWSAEAGAKIALEEKKEDKAQKQSEEPALK